MSRRPRTHNANAGTTTHNNNHNDDNNDNGGIFLTQLRQAMEHVADEAQSLADLFRGPTQNNNATTPANGIPSFFAQQPPPPSPSKVPPASRQAIRELPTIRIESQDLIEPTNRECSICLDENCLGDRVTRLPCAHLFHQACIHDWLSNHSCSCPICRYELPTDDPDFEKGRKERMKHRPPPRFARHELERLSVSELLKLANPSSTSAQRQKAVRRDVHGMTKGQLRDYVVEQKRVVLIPAPPPVEYQLSTLKKMSVSQLKRAMEEAGVFFRPQQDVVEKGDIYRLFQNSGRLRVLPEQEDENDDDGDVAMTSSTMSDTTKAPASMEQQQREAKRKNVRASSLVETVDAEEEEVEQGIRSTRSSASCRAIPSFEVVDMFGPPPQRRRATMPFIPTTTAARRHPQPGDMKTDRAFATASSNIASSEARSLSPVSPVARLTSRKRDIDTPWCSDMDSGNNCSIRRPNDPFPNASIGHLQELARLANIDLTHCVERRDMVDALVAAGLTGDEHSANSTERDVLRARFSSWSLSQLRVLIKACHIDLEPHRHYTQSEWLDCLLDKATSTTSRAYLTSLAPLAGQSLPELRGTARSWQVDISHCLEKEEIFESLIAFVTNQQQQLGNR